MTKEDKKTLVFCANLIVEQAAALEYWQRHYQHGSIGNITATREYVTLAQQLQPHLGVMRDMAQSRKSDKAAFDTLRRFLGIVASYSLGQ